jgi:hypothetical protein
MLNYFLLATLNFIISTAEDKKILADIVGNLIRKIIERQNLIVLSKN